VEEDADCSERRGGKVGTFNQEKRRKKKSLCEKRKRNLGRDPSAWRGDSHLGDREMENSLPRGKKKGGCRGLDQRGERLMVEGKGRAVFVSCEKDVVSGRGTSLGGGTSFIITRED